MNCTERGSILNAVLGEACPVLRACVRARLNGGSKVIRSIAHARLRRSFIPGLQYAQCAHARCDPEWRPGSVCGMFWN